TQTAEEHLAQPPATSLGRRTGGYGRRQCGERRIKLNYGLMQGKLPQVPCTFARLDELKQENFSVTFLLLFYTVMSEDFIRGFFKRPASYERVKDLANRRNVN